MKRFPARILERLDLLSAVRDEVHTPRNYIPPEPWLDVVSRKDTAVAEWVRHRLRSGGPAIPNVTVNVRKPSLATRPVPIVGITERVIYRALTNYILGDHFDPDRSAVAYRRFLDGPIDHVFNETTLWKPGTESISYIAETDIAAFYDYIDHDILRDELTLQFRKVDSVDLLMDLLAETQQRRFGLPQMLDASDSLSEIYIRLITRDLKRAGRLVWRYNDDFKIGCTDYTDALDAIEQLDEAARVVGLIVSAHKTYTTKFANYVLRTSSLDEEDIEAGLNRTDIETPVVTDYHDETDVDIETALHTLARILRKRKDSDGKTIRNPTAVQVRDLTRALRTLTGHHSTDGLEYVTELLIYLRSLTPHICNYLIEVAPTCRSSIERIVDDLIDNKSLGEWQALWLVYVCRTLDLFNDPVRREWATKTRERGRGRPLGAEAALALAEVGAANVNDLDRALRVEPKVLAPWFLLGIRSMAIRYPDRHDVLVQALCEGSSLNRILLKQ